MRLCSNCETMVEKAEAKLCPNCGAVLPGALPPPPPSPLMMQQGPPLPPRKGRWPGGALGVILIVLLALAGIVLLIGLGLFLLCIGVGRTNP